MPIRKHLRTWQGYTLLLLLTAALVVSRRPGALFHAQFNSEDAKWFAEAYNQGPLSVLFAPYSGYLCILQRLVAAFTLLFPILFAPLIMNVAALIIQGLPVLYLWSSRLANWATLPTRALMAFVYLALPGPSIVHMMITCSQWPLALLACLIVVSPPATDWRWRTFDVTIVLLTGLSGPFSVILAPLALAFAWRQRTDWRSPVYLALIASSLVEFTTMVVLNAMHAPWAMGGRLSLPLGATPELLVRILGGNVFWTALVGANHVATRQGSRIVVLAAIIGFLGVTILIYTLVRAPREFKLLIVFCLSVFALSLKSPLMSVNGTQWPLVAAYSELQYYLLPKVIFVWSLVWCVTSDKVRYARYAAALPLLLLLIKLPVTWKYREQKSFGYQQYVKELEKASPGTVVKIPVFPGGDWVIYLKKR